MKENDPELIQKFLDNELNEDEAALFRSKYGADPEFKREVNLRSGIYISLDAASRASLKALSENPEKRRYLSRPDSRRRSPVRRIRTYLQFAAAAAAVLAIGIVLFFSLNSKPSYDELFTAYYQPPDKTSIPRPRGGIDLNDFSFLIKEIDQGNLSARDTLQTTDEFFYFGIYCMNHQRFDEAIYAFSELIKANDRYYQDGSEWYLGLCYLHTGRIEDAIRAFSEIASTRGHEYQEESRELLSKLQ